MTAKGGPTEGVERSVPDASSHGRETGRASQESQEIIHQGGGNRALPFAPPVAVH